MKKLFIVRHAKSSWDSPYLDDHDRPLNKRGKDNAPEMGRRLAKRNVLPDLMISSSAKRAFSTAKFIAKKISFPTNKIRKESLFYHGNIENIISIIQNVDDSVNILMIYGHNPGMTDLTNYLTGSMIYNIPTCGITEVDFYISSWNLVEKYTGKLISFDYPKKTFN